MVKSTKNLCCCSAQFSALCSVRVIGTIVDRRLDLPCRFNDFRKLLTNFFFRCFPEKWKINIYMCWGNCCAITSHHHYGNSLMQSQSDVIYGTEIVLFLKRTQSLLSFEIYIFSNIQYIQVTHLHFPPGRRKKQGFFYGMLLLLLSAVPLRQPFSVFHFSCLLCSCYLLVTIHLSFIIDAGCVCECALRKRSSGVSKRDKNERYIDKFDQR